MVYAEFPDRSRDRAVAPVGADEDEATGPGPGDRRDDPPGEEPGVESGDSAGEAPPDVPTRAIDRFRAGRLGSVTAAAMLGLRDALEGRREERPAIEQPASRSLDEEDDFELHLEPGSPEQSYVVFRRQVPPPDD